MRLLRTCFAVAALLAAGPVFAEPECTCLANGTRYAEGSVVCLRLPSGSWLARCGKVLNNTSWQKIEDGCPTTLLAPEMTRAPTASKHPVSQSSDGD
ncbi:hypothetical protein GN330_09420 [Nitratireductor sp. CAU 1489]|uniref:Uncharacterized protein n=1 Tax=Nitratireductor arenosus TaxID=2682096 RepID=A0A844QBR7_9HYPH|nr:hypothetical protein [Nitratireductor arenosus]MVA97466.1 hypothetical protein [Nitratireductor arenosus]